MLKNMNYDLAEDLAQRSKQVWRYEQYTQDAGPGCGRCQNLWQQLRQQDEKSIELLKQEIENHVKEEMFD